MVAVRMPTKAIKRIATGLIRVGRWFLEGMFIFAFRRVRL